MKKTNLSWLVAVTLLMAACSKDDTVNDAVFPATEEALVKDSITPQQINAQIDQSLQETGEFDWKQASNNMLWSAVHHGREVVSIGFGTHANDFDRSKSPQNAQIQDQLLQIVMAHEGKPLNQTLLAADSYLNTMDVAVTRQETIIALRRSNLVRYLEPADYRYFEVAHSLERSDESSSSGGSGCGYDAATLAAADYTTVTPNAKAAWTLYQHNVPSAWAYSTGQGITIGIVDTGTSPNQTLLGSSFNDGLSTGRTIQKFGTYVDSIWPWSTGTDGPNDQCGHGTSMASAAAAPRNDNGLPVGVAYNANLITYRAAANVVLDGAHEQNGVKNAFTALGNNAAVKIISMSMGHVFSVGKISDGVKYAHSKGKLIFCAGGTSTSFTTFVGVIFPASMAEAVAVTGIKEGGYVKCDDCHSGSKIDFTVVMQRAATGNTVPVVSYHNNQSDYVGGSSVATATTAGIAALVWAKNPTWNRDQVLAKMRQSAHFYPNKNAQFGYGNINALLAVQ
ncbi:S8 family peptidase [Flavobacterium caeni]|uniref:Subtilase family protein n=1 Tax=Flavobacterium caeni TaxID=490189 RepID=A0A1G5BI39_9FLAO|nr:S8/S53 family peptidase [Flavobacterium caeni]SCX89767.1 Subtilase family protein [Flavobacterium caeni]